MREALPPNSIFICYRRLDSEEMVDRIYEDLRPRFSPGAIFRDVDTIPAGVDFPTYIQRSLRDCAVVLVFIGTEWPTVLDNHGKRRIEDPGDHVRVEIETALGMPDARVIPILVKRGVMPGDEHLPETLRPLRRRNGRLIRSAGADYKRDLEDLAEVVRNSALEVHATRKAARSSEQKRTLRHGLHAIGDLLRRAGMWSWVLGAGCAGALAFVLVGKFGTPRPAAASATPAPATLPPQTPVVAVETPAPIPATPTPVPEATPTPPAKSTTKPKASPTSKPKTSSNPSRTDRPSIPKGFQFKKPKLPF